jgi:hypothetical protein
LLQIKRLMKKADKVEKMIKQMKWDPRPLSNWVSYII